MALMLGKIIVASILISLVSWLSGKKGELAGFLTALPLTSMLALAFSQLEWRNSANSVAYAKSIFIAIPASLLFFVPFLLAQKLNLSFWGCYLCGVAMIGIGYFGHSWIIKVMGG